MNSSSTWDNVKGVVTALGVIAVIFGLGAGWATHNADFKALQEKVDGMDEKAAHQICTDIVSRQMLAMEKDNEVLTSRLGGMSMRYGCIKDTGALLASIESGGPIPTSMSGQMRSEALRDLSEIDSSVDWATIEEAFREGDIEGYGTGGTILDLQRPVSE